MYTLPMPIIIKKAMTNNVNYIAQELHNFT